MHDFESASKAVLEYLRGELDMGLWMVTRMEGDDWIVLTSEDHGYGIAPGDVFRWSDSFCSRMVQGHGPGLAPVAADVPAYRDAPVARQLQIGAYVGAALTGVDGRLFGTLCAIDPNPRPDATPRKLVVVELLAGLLSGILGLELRASEAERIAERARAESAVDELTGIYNRRGWNNLVAVEEDRCRRYGHAAAVISIDVDGLKTVNDSQGHAAGDDLLVRCSSAIQAVVRGHDFAARLGGDEFAVLAVQSDEAGAAAFAARVAASLVSRGVEASIGYAVRTPATGIAGALHCADLRMYDNKALRRTSRLRHVA